MDKSIVENITNHRTSRTKRADVGINEDDDNALSEIARGHFGHYNRSAMMRMCVTFFLKTYDKVYQFDPDMRDAVMIAPSDVINTNIEEEPVLCGVGEPTLEKITNLDNLTDPYRMIRGVKAISRYVGFSMNWTSLHMQEIHEAGAAFKVSRGRIGGQTWAAYPYFLMIYFTAKHKTKSHPGGYAVTRKAGPGRPKRKLVALRRI